MISCAKCKARHSADFDCVKMIYVISEEEKKLISEGLAMDKFSKEYSTPRSVYRKPYSKRQPSTAAKNKRQFSLHSS